MAKKRVALSEKQYTKLLTRLHTKDDLSIDELRDLDAYLETLERLEKAVVRKDKTAATAKAKKKKVTAERMEEVRKYFLVILFA